MGLGDLAKLLDAVARFFDLSRRAFVLIATLAIVAVIVAFIDADQRITDVPRAFVLLLYFLGTFSGLYLLLAGLVWAGQRGLEHVHAIRNTRSANRNALTNLKAAPNLHRATLIYLKQRDTKRWQDEEYNTLLAMHQSGYLTYEPIRHDAAWFEVADVIWNDPTLAAMAEQSPRIPAKPWHPEHMMNHR